MTAHNKTLTRKKNVSSQFTAAAEPVLTFPLYVVYLVLC